MHSRGSKATDSAKVSFASSLDCICSSLASYSKREYLLAQIRQKDAIIESLLKQVCRLDMISSSRSRLTTLTLAS